MLALERIERPKFERLGTACSDFGIFRVSDVRVSDVRVSDVRFSAFHCISFTLIVELNYN